MKICLVDDHSLFSEGLADIIKSHFSDCTIKIFNNSLKAFQDIISENYQIILSDINMPSIDGFELLGMVKKIKPDIIFILISVRNDSFSIEKAKTLKANGYVFKNDSKQVFIDAIQEALNGKDFFKVKEKSFDGFVFSDGSIVKLTNREIEVLQLLTKELATKEIASKMNISENTVIGYRKSLFQKFQVKNMIGLVKYAYEIGLI